ncbi:MAG TPA: DUF1501 domain-containing protein [Polyangiaceae bacterium]|nr:DUF1501 domain-containing protein [Polyangiaceae bacterium]
MLNRRDALLATLFGAGYVGVQAIATGLPAWFIANPKRATAQSLQCATDAVQNMQYLVVSASSNGDPINCNCPGTYEDATAVHPNDAQLAPTPVDLGGRTYTTALPWASKEGAGGLMPDAVLARTNFFHYRTGSVVHGDQAKVMKMMGATNNGEMLISLYAKYLSQCLGTVQAEPISVGAGRNATELLSYAGRPAANVSPSSLKAMLGSSGGGTGGGRPAGGGQFGGNSQAAALKSLRTIRDTTMDQLNQLAKRDSTNVQMQFLDALSRSQAQVRSLQDKLATALGSVNGDDVKSQAYAAAALISANVTPVVTMRIAFGGDNHSDQNLAAEVAQHVTGVQGIADLMTALQSLNLIDKVTFATLNVFGRNLNGIAKTDSRSGRDHYGNHAVCVLIGKNIKPGVTGGVLPGSGGSGGPGGGSGSALGAAPIESETGLGSANGDIKPSETYGALARTLGVALGLNAADVDKGLNANAGGKVVRTTVVNGTA